MDTAAECREFGFSEATYHRWRKSGRRFECRGRKRLNDLERENSTLKRLLADAELEKAALKEIARETPRPGTTAGGCRSPPADAGSQRAVRLPRDRAAPRTHRHEPIASPPDGPDAALRDWWRTYVKDHPPRGFRPASHDACGEGGMVNHKEFQCFWREEGLWVP